MKNSDAKGRGRRSERSIETAGKRPFHRVEKLQKLRNRLVHDPKGTLTEEALEQELPNA